MTTRIGSALATSGRDLDPDEDVVRAQQDDEAVVDLGNPLDELGRRARDVVELVALDRENLFHLVDDDPGRACARLHDHDLLIGWALVAETEPGGEIADGDD